MKALPPLLLVARAVGREESCLTWSGCQRLHHPSSFLQQRVLLTRRKANATAEDSGRRAEVLQVRKASSPRTPDHPVEAIDGPSPFAWAYAGASCALGPVVWAVRTCCRGPQASEAPAQRGSQDWLAYLDLWRVLCVAVVVISHAGGDWEAYVEYNMLGGQQWVLPVLILVSATCYARTSAALLDSVARLLLYFSLGSALNWLAGLAAGARWWEEVAARGVTFQMFYVVGLAAAMIVLAPLKAMLKSRPFDADDYKGRQLTVGYGFSLLVALLTAVALSGSNPTHAQLLRLLAESLTTMLVAVNARSFLTQGLTGWLVLAWIYITRILHPEPRPGTEFHLFDLFVFALLVHKVPLWGQESLGLALARWWPVLCFACGFLLHPGLRLREDLFPSASIINRLRQYAVEAIAVLAFTCVPSAGPQRTLPLPDLLRANLPWANRWALFAYCSHYALYRLVPAQLVGVPLMFAAAVPFAAFDWCTRSRGSCGLTSEAEADQAGK